MLFRSIDSHLKAVDFEQFPCPHGKLGIRIKTPESMYTLLRRIMKRSDMMKDEGDFGSAVLVTAILADFGYEWV